jgi:hypothetical protein
METAKNPRRDTLPAIARSPFCPARNHGQEIEAAKALLQRHAPPPAHAK